MLLSQNIQKLVGLLVVSGIAVACSSDDNGSSPAQSSAGGSTSGSGSPTIAITAPAAGATVTASATSPDVDVTLDVKNFTLKAPGQCAGAATCGHVHFLVDGTACNDVNSPYNAIYPDPADPTAGSHIGLDYCKSGIPGAHTITAELHKDDHSPVKDAGGATISASVAVTVGP